MNTDDEPVGTILRPENGRERRAVEVCRLLSALDWCIGYELTESSQVILDRARELALSVIARTSEEGPHDTGYIRDDLVYATLKRWCKCGPRIHCSFCAIRRELEAATTKQPTEVKEGDDG